MITTNQAYLEALMAYYRTNYQSHILIFLLLQWFVDQKIAIYENSEGLFTIKSLNLDPITLSPSEKEVAGILFQKRISIDLNHVTAWQEASLKLQHSLDAACIDNGIAMKWAFYLHLILWSLGAITTLIAGWLFLNLLYISTVTITVSVIFWGLSLFVPKMTSYGKTLANELKQEISQQSKKNHLSFSEWLKSIPLIWLGKKLPTWPQNLNNTTGIKIEHFLYQKSQLTSAQALCDHLDLFTKACKKTLADTKGAFQGVANQYDVSIGA